MGLWEKVFKRKKGTQTSSQFIEYAMQGINANCHLKITQFKSLYDDLDKGLFDKGITHAGTRVYKLHTHLRGVCPRCGLTLSGEWLGAVYTMMHFGAAIGSYGQSRFSMGLCPNEGCSSKEMVFSWQP